MTTPVFDPKEMEEAFSSFCKKLDSYEALKHEVSNLEQALAAKKAELEQLEEELF